MFQTHPILHAGLETDVANGLHPDDTVVGCEMESELLFRQDKRFNMVVHAALMHNAFETSSTDNLVCCSE